jgi:E3 ubiquitin-protein ligase RFWD2
VCFSPTREHQLAFGSSDHCVHVYDLRHTSRPLAILRGHDKAVSYVRYTDAGDLLYVLYALKINRKSFFYLFKKNKMK